MFFYLFAETEDFGDAASIDVNGVARHNFYEIQKIFFSLKKCARNRNWFDISSVDAPPGGCGCSVAAVVCNHSKKIKIDDAQGKKNKTTTSTCRQRADAGIGRPDRRRRGELSRYRR